MARTTKLELQQALNDLGTEVQALRLKVSQLTADNERLVGQLAAATQTGERYFAEIQRLAALADEAKRRQVTPARAQRTEQGPSAFQRACAAARKAAMRTGRVAKVALS